MPNAKGLLLSISMLIKIQMINTYSLILGDIFLSLIECIGCALT